MSAIASVAAQNTDGPTHRQPKEEQDEWLLLRFSKQYNTELLDAVGVDADIVEAILNVSFGHVHRATLQIGPINLEQ